MVKRHHDDLPAQETVLPTLGAAIRAHRKRLRVTATATAEAAGISRVTLHRIERGERSVAMGAYAAVASVLGLSLQLHDPLASSAGSEADGPLPDSIPLADYPQLQALAWQLNRATALTPREALDLYERNWRHVDTAAMGPHERALLNRLVRTLGGGRLLV